MYTVFFKSQKSDFDLTFLDKCRIRTSIRRAFYRQAGYFFVCKKWCPFLFFFFSFFLSLSLSLVVYFGAGSRSFVRHFFFCHHQIGPEDSYTSEEKVEEWIIMEGLK